MATPRILHMLTPLKHMSPFDVNMGLDAGFDHAIPYTNVTVEDVYGLVQDAIFSRGPEGIKRTAMFIGGKRAIEALDMMDRAKKAMVPPFEISVFADPAGSFTTAAAMVACAKKALREKFSLDLKGMRVVVFGGTGVVAFASAVIAVSDGAKATLVGYDGPERVKKLALEANARFDEALDYADGSTEEQKTALAREADIIFAAGPAGRRLLTTDQLKEAKKLKVAADVNAVPPSGIEGVGVNDNGKPIQGTNAVGIGALAVGNIKYKTEFGLFKMMIETREADLSRFQRRLRPCPEARWLIRPSLLIAAISGRAIAQSARRAGFVPLVADFFADVDTQQTAHACRKLDGDIARGMQWESLSRALEALAAASPSPLLGFVYGSGFEDRPELLTRIAKSWRLLGNDAATVERLKDPESFFAALDRLGIAHPLTVSETCQQEARSGAWLVKRKGGAGGSHIGVSATARGKGQRLLPGARRRQRRFSAVRRQWRRGARARLQRAMDARRPSAAPGAMAGQFALLGSRRQQRKRWSSAIEPP